MRLTAAAVLSTLVLVLPAFAQDIPVNDGFVTDVAGLLTTEQQESLELTLTTYQRETSNEIAILILKNLAERDIAEYAVEVGRAWGVGSEKDNGIMIVVGYESRDINISTGYGLEGAVPDIVAAGIINNDIAPQFKEGNYYEGLAAGIDALKRHIGGEYTADRYATSGDGFSPWIFFFIFICFNWLAAFFARTKSWWLGGVFGGIFGIILTVIYAWWISIPVLVLLGLFFDYIMSKGGPRRGGRGGGWGGFSGGGGGGGGGFGGFGGGSFGGGGASGKW